MPTETIKSKGSSAIPPEICAQAGIGPETEIEWSVLGNGQVLVAKRAQTPSAAQKHILEHAGKWDGEISGAELLRRTRP